MPTLNDIAEVIADVLYNITEELRTLPRVIDKFHGTEYEAKRLYLVISNDPDCQRLQSLIDNGNICKKHAVRLI